MPSQFKFLNKIEAHSSQISKVLVHPYQPNRLLTAGLDGLIVQWQLPKLIREKQIKFPTSQITSLVVFSFSGFRGFLVGTGSGDLIVTDQDLVITKKCRIHSESISEVIVTEENVVTVSLDGQVKFLSKGSFEIEQSVNLQSPLLSAKEYEGELYIAALQSFVMNIATRQIRQIKRFNSFSIANNKIFGCSADKGLTCLNKNSNTYVPTEYILPYRRKMLVFSEQSICTFNHLETMSWATKKYQEMSTGEEVKSADVLGHLIYFGGDAGNLYCIRDLEEELDSL